MAVCRGGGFQKPLRSYKTFEQVSVPPYLGLLFPFCFTESTAENERKHAGGCRMPPLACFWTAEGRPSHFSPVDSVKQSERGRFDLDGSTCR